MANTIKLKQSSVSSKVPIAGDLVQGELAINTADEKLYTKNSSGVVVEVGGGGAGFTSSTTAPTLPTPSDGDHWFDPDSAILYMRVASTWLDIATAGGAPTNVFSNSSTEPTSPTIGDTWYDPDTFGFSTRVNDSSGTPFWYGHTDQAVSSVGSQLNSNGSESYSYDASEIFDSGDAASTPTSSINGGT
ncbi:MAG TPA: hypothetical protein EYN67_12845, partial [Flavobacteriales bacterium]|nr:hypothetical protein [Flavobacteriales bacterium]